MAIKKVLHIVQRKLKQIWDMEHIQNVIYNEAAGAQKNITVEPVVKRATIANEQVGFGAYVKVAAGTTAYGMDCLGKAHDAGATYRRGDIVTQGTDVYVANQDIRDAHAFDAGEWTKVAPKQILAIPTYGGAVVSTGKWHNAITVAGFLLDDESLYKKVE